MIRRFNIRNFLKKDIKTICLGIGGFYIVFGIFALLQTLLVSQFDTASVPDETFSKSFELLQEIWFVFMPLMVLLGIGYVLFGLSYLKMGKNKYQISLALRILSFIWVFTYMIMSVQYFEVFFDFSHDPIFFKYIAYLFAGFGSIAVFALFTVPQYVIDKRIKKEKIL